MQNRKNLSEILLINIIGSVSGDIILIEEKKQHIEYRIREIKKRNNTGKVAIGSIVTLLDDYGDRERYYIIKRS